MRHWILAILYAAVAAGFLVWLDPDASFAGDLVARTAMLVLPMRLAIQLESRCGGCWLSRIWS